MTKVTFTLDTLGPFEGDYKGDGSQFDTSHRIEFETPAEFPRHLEGGRIEIRHPNGELVFGMVHRFDFVVVPGTSSVEFISLEPAG